MAPCAWQMLVMIPKGVVTHFRGIGLVEVLWKVIPDIINLRISSSIQFHNTLHVFSAGRGTGTATIKEKLPQHLIFMR